MHAVFVLGGGGDSPPPSSGQKDDFCCLATVIPCNFFLMGDASYSKLHCHVAHHIDAGLRSLVCGNRLYSLLPPSNP
jgi:hypothetical protein